MMGPVARRSRRRSGIAARGAAALAITALLSLGCAHRVLERPWLEARSEHFAIYSTLTPEETRELAVDLEVFRAAVGLFTNVRSLDPPIPVEIYAFGRAGDFRRFAPSRNVAGFIRPNPRSYQVLLGRFRGVASRTILYHEYVHFLLRNNGGMLLPRWYDEGFAEFLGTAERRDETLVIGLPDPMRASWLVAAPPMEVEDVLDPGTLGGFHERQVARFYARAWLLVHFLSWDYEDPEGLRFTDRFSTYLSALGKGVAPAEALELAWGFGPSELDGMLNDTVRKGVKTGSLPLEKLRYSDRVELGPAPRPEMATRLASLALAADPGLARRLFEAALAADPGNARALAGLGDSYKFEGRMEEALPHFDRALELDPTDPLNWLDRAEYRLDRAVREEDPARKSELAEQARLDAEAARRLEPRSPEALWVYGASLSLLAGREAEGVAVLEEAARTLPSDQLILGSLLQAYVAVGRQPDARRVAQHLVAMAHDQEEIAAIERLLEGESPAQ